MKLVTGKQMAKIDEMTSKEYKFPSLLLMENAARSVLDSALSDFPELYVEPSLILIGPGNNGGDATVIARQMHNKGIPVICAFIGNPDKLTKDAKTNYDIHFNLKLNEKKAPFFVIDNLDKWKELKSFFLAARFLFDGLFGTGIDSEIMGIYKDIIKDINNDFDGIVLSIDVPSGLICNHVKQNDLILRAEKTYTIGLPKLGMINYPGKEYCGEIETVNIGFPEELLTSDDIKTHYVDETIIASLKPVRPPDSHKGTFGHTLIVAGSGHYPGAAHLAAMGAKQAGAGLVTLASMFTVCNGLKSKENEIIIKSFEDVISQEDMDSLKNNILKNEIAEEFIKEQGLSFEDIDTTEFIGEENFKEIEETLEDYTSAVIGPGMGQNQDTFGFIKKFLLNFENPVVIDADALNFISQDMNILKDFGDCSRFIFTPHIGEFSRLCGESIPDIKDNQLEIAMSFAKKHGIILVLKDSVTVTTNGDKAFYNSTGNSGLSKGGSGDVLSGIIGAMLSRGLKPLNAAVFSVYLHGIVADIIAQDKGVEGVTPTGLINEMYRGFLEI